MKIFISKKMTRVLDAVETGSGMLLANLREIPESSVMEAVNILKSATSMGIADITQVGESGKSVLNAPIDPGKVGVVVYAGTNIMAAVEESGINVDTYPISTIMDFKDLKKL
jgi:repressor of nif and glnA expression